MMYVCMCVYDKRKFGNKAIKCKCKNRPTAK